MGKVHVEKGEDEIEFLLHCLILIGKCIFRAYQMIQSKL